MTTQGDKRKSRLLSATFPRHVRWSIVIALVCLLGTGLIMQAQTGATYELLRSVLSEGGGYTGSGNYRLNYSIGQASTVGLSEGSRYLR